MCVVQLVVTDDTTIEKFSFGARRSRAQVPV